MGDLVVAADIGGTKTAVGLVSDEGEVLASATRPTPGADGPSAVLECVATLVAEVLASVGRGPGEVVGLGVGSAGVIDAHRGVVLSSTDVLRDWAGTDVASGLARLTGIPHVRVDNDVHAHAVGEAWRGAGGQARSALFVAVGTGVGASLTVDGRPWHGGRGVAGHLGHVPSAAATGRPCVCGGSGHLEAVAAGPAMVLDARQRGADVASLHDVARLARDGDETCLQVLHDGAAALGSAVGGAVNLLDPEVAVVGGGVVGVGNVWWRPMVTALTAELLPPLRGIPVVPASLGTTAALVGAARLALSEAA